MINRKTSSTKHLFIEITRQYYRDNKIINRVIHELDEFYRPAEVINWCLRSPFPSRYLLHALRSHKKEQLDICRFLFSDAVHLFQQYSKRKFNAKFYRGMKLPGELLDKLKACVGQHVCTSGFFPCIKSRSNALTLATLSTYRSDLSPVLFKIDCHTLAPCIELTKSP